MTITDTATGEILVEKKFHKPKFNEIMINPEYAPYIDDLLEVVMVKKFNKDDLEINPDSYEEMRSLADAMSECEFEAAD